MKDFVEQRRAKRFRCESPLMCSNLDASGVVSGRSLNHCSRGIAFVSHLPMESGATIYFRTDSFAQKRFKNSSCEGMRGMGLAMVRWCRPIADSNPVAYQIGAEYLGPYP
jgi:hypothetical protein